MPHLKFAPGLQALTPHGQALVTAVVPDYRGRPGVALKYPDGSSKTLWQRNCAIVKGQQISKDMLTAEKVAVDAWKVEVKKAAEKGVEPPLHPSLTGPVAFEEPEADVDLSLVPTMKAADAVALIEATSYATALADALDAEMAGRDRKSVKAAIEAQLAATSTIH